MLQASDVRPRSASAAGSTPRTATQPSTSALMASRFVAINEAILHIAPLNTRLQVVAKPAEYCRRLIRQFGPSNILLVRPHIAPGTWRTKTEGEAAAFRAMESMIARGLVLPDGRRFEWVHGRFRDTSCWFVDSTVASGAAVRAWHLPDTADNRRMGMFKLCARLDLMLSKTTAVATVLPNDDAGPGGAAHVSGESGQGGPPSHFGQATWAAQTSAGTTSGLESWAGYQPASSSIPGVDSLAANVSQLDLTGDEVMSDGAWPSSVSSAAHTPVIAPATSGTTAGIMQRSVRPASSSRLPLVSLIHIPDVTSQPATHVPGQATHVGQVAPGQVMTDGCAPAGLEVMRIAARGLQNSKVYSALETSSTAAPSAPSATTNTAAVDVVDVALPSQHGHTHAAARSAPGQSQHASIASDLVDDQLSTEPVPAVFQGRLGGYKGVWYADPRLPPMAMAVRPSQCKVEIPGAVATETQRHVEVIRVSADKGPALLNMQVAALLTGWGVQASTLLQLQSEAVQPMLDMCSNEDAARAVLYLPPSSSGVSARAALDSIARSLSARAECSMTAQQEDLARSMLASGLWGEHRLQTALQKIRARLLRRWLRKNSGSGANKGWLSSLSLPVAQSRTVYAIADPTGLLQPGQVYFRCPEAVGQSSSDGHAASDRPGVLRGSMLLARNPCHRPEHLQLVTAVSLVDNWKSRHRVTPGGHSTGHVDASPMPGMPNPSGLSLQDVEAFERLLVDVIVLPVTGDVPLISLLSGGDYDGDKVWACWEPRLVEPVARAKASWTHAQAQDSVGDAAAPAPHTSAGQRSVASQPITQPQHHGTTHSNSTWPPSSEDFARFYLSSIVPDALTAGGSAGAGQGSGSTYPKAPGKDLGWATNLHLAWLDRYLHEEEQTRRQQASLSGPGQDLHDWGFSATEAGMAPLSSTQTGQADNAASTTSVTAAPTAHTTAPGSAPDPTPSTALWQPRCLQLADLCSSMVDAPKTGVHASIPGWCRNVEYPHYMRPTAHGTQGSSMKTCHSVSPLGQLADAASTMASSIRMELTAGHAAGKAKALPATSTSGGVQPAAQLDRHAAELLQPWLDSRTPWMPHVDIVAAAVREGFSVDPRLCKNNMDRLMYEAQLHFQAFCKEMREVSQANTARAGASAGVRGGSLRQGGRSRTSSLGSASDGLGDELNNDDSEGYSTGGYSTEGYGSFGLDSDSEGILGGSGWGSGDSDDGDEGGADDDGDADGRRVAKGLMSKATGSSYSALEDSMNGLVSKYRQKLLFVDNHGHGAPAGGGQAARSAQGLSRYGQGTGQANGTQAIPTTPTPRDAATVRRLALCYYMLSWHEYRVRWDDAVDNAARQGVHSHGAAAHPQAGHGQAHMGNGMPAQPPAWLYTQFRAPYAFPWTVAGQELVQAVLEYKSATAVNTT